MADATIGVLQATSPDRLLDAEFVASLSAYRERNRVAGLAAAELAEVRNATPGATDYGLATRPINSDIVGTLAALGALNAAASINAAGMASVGMLLAAGTLIGTIVAEASVDGGTTWIATAFDDPVSGNKVGSIVFGSANTVTTRTVVGVGGCSQYRVRVSAYTSGTANCTLRGSLIKDPSVLFATVAGQAGALTVAQVGGVASAAAPTYGAGIQPLSLDLAGNVRVIATGTELHNSSTATADAIEVIGGLANAADPAFTEAKVVLLSTDLAGYMRSAVKPAGQLTYGASSNGFISSGTAGATTLSLGYLFHPSSVTTLKYKLAKLRVSWAGGQGGDPILLKLSRITAENGTPGGTLQTNQGHNNGNASSSAIFRTGATGAPTRGTILDCISITVDFPGQYEFDLSPYLNGQSYEMQKSTAEGWEAHIVTGTTGPTVAASFAVSAAWSEQSV